VAGLVRHRCQWRGVTALIALRGPAPGTAGFAACILAIARYAPIAALAIAPHLVSGIGLSAAPVRAEAILLTILVFVGVNVAWLLLFEGTPDPAFRQQDAQARNTQPCSTYQLTCPPHSRLTNREDSRPPSAHRQIRSTSVRRAT